MLNRTWKSRCVDAAGFPSIFLSHLTSTFTIILPSSLRRNGCTLHHAPRLRPQLSLHRCTNLRHSGVRQTSLPRLIRQLPQEPVFIRHIALRDEGGQRGFVLEALVDPMSDQTPILRNIFKWKKCVLKTCMCIVYIYTTYIYINIDIYTYIYRNHLRLASGLKSCVHLGHLRWDLIWLT